MGFLERHDHISERETAHTWPDGRPDDAKWEDCLWASVVEWYRATGADVPATHAEAEALRGASGEPPTGGSSLENVQDGMLERYKVKPPISPATAVLELAVGRVAVATGRMGNFPAGSKWRRWDPGFIGAHGALVARLDDQARVWWCDPLAPETVGGVPWKGEWMSIASLRTFVGSTTGGSLVGTIAEQEAEMIVGGGLVRTSNYIVPDVVKDTKFYQDAACTVPLTRASWTEPTDLEYFGIAHAASWAVEISTVATFGDGKSRPVICYVRRADVKAPIPKPPSVAEYNLGVEAASKAALTAKR